jgi:hypothetical protein
VTALVQALSRYRATKSETDLLTVAAQFCGAVLLVAMMYASYGLDLSPGFF